MMAMLVLGYRQDDVVYLSTHLESSLGIYSMPAARSRMICMVEGRFGEKILTPEVQLTSSSGGSSRTSSVTIARDTNRTTETIALTFEL